MPRSILPGTWVASCGIHDGQKPVPSRPTSAVTRLAGSGSRRGELAICVVAALPAPVSGADSAAVRGQLAFASPGDGRSAVVE